MHQNPRIPKRTCKTYLGRGREKLELSVYPAPTLRSQNRNEPFPRHRELLADNPHNRKNQPEVPDTQSDPLDSQLWLQTNYLA